MVAVGGVRQVIQGELQFRAGGYRGGWRRMYTVLDTEENYFAVFDKVQHGKGRGRASPRGADAYVLLCPASALRP